MAKSIDITSLAKTKSDASGSTFHRPLNIDMMWQYKKKVSNNECKLSVCASRSGVHNFSGHPCHTGDRF